MYNDGRLCTLLDDANMGDAASTSLRSPVCSASYGWPASRRTGAFVPAGLRSPVGSAGCDLVTQERHGVSARGRDQRRRGRPGRPADFPARRSPVAGLPGYPRPPGRRQTPLESIACREERAGVTPGEEGLSPVEKLDATHDVDSFECGKEPLDRFLKRFALANQKAESARTYVACRGLTVLAYYSLSAGAVEHGERTS